MSEGRGASTESSGERILAYTDTHLCYCPQCAHRMGYDQWEKWGPNWLPFIAITDSGEVPEKYCDACETCLEREL